eukprot:7784875-Pyramimonas_sp.AAC.1
MPGRSVPAQWLKQIDEAQAETRHRLPSPALRPNVEAQNQNCVNRAIRKHWMFKNIGFEIHD